MTIGWPGTRITHNGPSPTFKQVRELAESGDIERAHTIYLVLTACVGRLPPAEIHQGIGAAAATRAKREFLDMIDKAQDAITEGA